MTMRMAGVLTLAAALAALPSNALTHDPHGGGGSMPQRSHGPMMGQGDGQMTGSGGMGSGGMTGHGRMGAGMMGHGRGPMMGHPCMMGHSGMMGPGMMGRGMMGHSGMMGRGASPMMGGHGVEPLSRDLTVDEVQHMMGHRVAASGNPNLNVGEVTEKDEDTIIADVETKDGSLVRRFAIDRHTGAMQPDDRGE